MEPQENDRFFWLVKGAFVEDWRRSGCLRAPGGEGPLPEWQDDGASLTKIRFQTESGGEVDMRARWQSAQGAEAAFWRSWRRNVLYRNTSLERFWAGVLEKTGGELLHGYVLDIGCGPVSALNFYRGEGVRAIGLDPLAKVFADEGLVECRSGWTPIAMVALPAEQLPFADESLDHLLCFNVLDHVADAPAVLREMRRILKPGGTVRIYVHTFSKWIKNWLFFDRPHTYHWDHREFRTLVENAGFGVVGELMEPKTFQIPKRRLGRVRYFPYWVATKVSATSYFQLRKP